MRLVRDHCGLPAGAPVLEVGCNAGRNLEHLFGAGHRNLSAIEINADAIALLRRSFPDMAARLDLRHGPAENLLPGFPSAHFDLVFTMAVLEHLHDDSESVFAGIARVCRRFLITIEDEHRVSWRHFPRNYRKVFEPLGLAQILEQRCDPAIHGLSEVHVARVFRRAQG